MLRGHDKIDVKHVYTEVDFAIGSQFIRHVLDDSYPIADLQGNKCGWSSARIKGRGKLEYHEKSRRPASSSGTILTSKNPGVTRPGIEHGSHRWEASRLTAEPPRPLTVNQLYTVNVQRKRENHLARGERRNFRVSSYRGSRGRGGVVVRLLASHRSEPGSNTGRAAPRFSHAELSWTMPLVCGICVYPALSFLLYTYLVSPSSALKTSLEEPPKPLHSLTCVKHDELLLSITVTGFELSTLYFVIDCGAEIDVHVMVVCTVVQSLRGLVRCRPHGASLIHHTFRSTPENIYIVAAVAMEHVAQRTNHAFPDLPHPVALVAAASRGNTPRFCSYTARNRGKRGELLNLLFQTAGRGRRWLSGYTARLPPRRTGFNPRPPSHSEIFASGNRAGRCLCSASFLGDLPFPPYFHIGAAPLSFHFTLINSHDVVFKSRPNITTQAVGGARMKGRGKRESPEKTRLPTTSSGTIPTCENPVTRPGIETSSQWWEASPQCKMMHFHESAPTICVPFQFVLLVNVLFPLLPLFRIQEWMAAHAGMFTSTLLLSDAIRLNSPAPVLDCQVMAGVPRLIAKSSGVVMWRRSGSTRGDQLIAKPRGAVGCVPPFGVGDSGFESRRPDGMRTRIFHSVSPRGKIHRSRLDMRREPPGKKGVGVFAGLARGGGGGRRREAVSSLEAVSAATHSRKFRRRLPTVFARAMELPPPPQWLQPLSGALHPLAPHASIFPCPPGTTSGGVCLAKVRGGLVTKREILSSREICQRDAIFGCDTGRATTSASQEMPDSSSPPPPPVSLIPQDIQFLKILSGWKRERNGNFYLKLRTSYNSPPSESFIGGPSVHFARRSPKKATAAWLKIVWHQRTTDNNATRVSFLASVSVKTFRFVSLTKQDCGYPCTVDQRLEAKQQTEESYLSKVEIKIIQHHIHLLIQFICIRVRRLDTALRGSRAPGQALSRGILLQQHPKFLDVFSHLRLKSSGSNISSRPVSNNVAAAVKYCKCALADCLRCIRGRWWSLDAAAPKLHATWCCSYVCTDTYQPGLRGTHLRRRGGTAQTLSASVHWPIASDVLEDAGGLSMPPRRNCTLRGAAATCALIRISQVFEERICGAAAALRRHCPQRERYWNWPASSEAVLLSNKSTNEDACNVGNKSPSPRPPSTLSVRFRYNERKAW
ncbi:hypothetical protein PR048_010397 [Dryococelus australis]|uniref:Uncharacterized protein n=1 Tax=Dryococelus australis TaxID=614101 RepID=A0ABQ9I4L0_9NEOP|nr:hypothetical protein PR048_010397 [Dryococelus australis]